VKIIIAPQAFKGTLSAQAAAEAMAKGVFSVLPKAEAVLVPVADGGEGTLKLLMQARRGHIHTVEVKGSQHQNVLAQWGKLSDSQTALIELASICGLELLLPEERNPLLATTYGVGEVILDALDAGCRHFLIGLGGSATNDAGAGIFQALGGLLLDKSGDPLPLGGGALLRLASIDSSRLDPRVKECSFLVACDVINPLLGHSGASKVYSPQKGASPEIAEQLEQALLNFCSVVKTDLGMDISTMPYGGSAGGAAAGLSAFFSAVLCSGAELILKEIKFAEMLEGADLVITGEGCLDVQTLYHKAVFAVAKIAKAMHVPVLAVVGSLGKEKVDLHKLGVDAVMPLSFVPFSIGTEPKNSAELLEQAVEQALRIMLLNVAFYTKQRL